MSASSSCSLRLPILAEPPAVTWGLHVALIDGAVACGLSLPGIERLAEVDDLHVQVALASVKAAAALRTGGP